MTDLAYLCILLTCLLIFPLMAAAQGPPEAYSEETLRDKTPPALPQTPRAEKPRSDAEDDGLKGRVKRVVTELRQDPKGDVTVHFEQYFDEKGDLVMDAGGGPGMFPPSVTVWGYIDGYRVSLDGPDSEFEFEGITVPPKVRKEEPGRDARYNTLYKYRYDDHGRLVETWMYENNGKPINHAVITITGDRYEKIIYVSDRKNPKPNTDLRAGHSVETLDKNGHAVKMVGYAGQKVIATAEFAYTYDSRGNWITKTTRAEVKLDGENIEKRSEFEIRTITYYP